MKRWHEVAAVLALLTVTALPASAKPAQPIDGGWLAWQGCWHALGEPADKLLCIIPDGDGARIITVVAGKIQGETRMTADGRARPVSMEGCAGTESAGWSKDGQRIFVKSEMMCGEKVRRRVTGIMAMPNAEEFINVQAVTSGDAVAARSKRYTAVEAINVPEEIRAALKENRLARETARYAASSRMDLADVVEANKVVDAAVVSEWLTAMNYRFDLNGKKLVWLADNGVPSSVIDVIVAISNPDHFAVRQVSNVRDDYPYMPRARGSIDPCYDYSYTALGYGYSYGRYGYNGCYYSPWGYDPYGWRRYGGTVVVVRGGDEGGTGEDGARVTRDGYSAGSGTTKGKAHTRDGSTNSYPPPSRTATESTSTRTSTSSGSSSSGAHATSGGYTAGSSTSGDGSGGGGRTAHPKDK